MQVKLFWSWKMCTFSSHAIRCSPAPCFRMALTLCTNQAVYTKSLKPHSWLQKERKKKERKAISFCNLSNILLLTSCLPDILPLDFWALWDAAQRTIGAYLLPPTVYWTTGPSYAHCLLSAWCVVLGLLKYSLLLTQIRWMYTSRTLTALSKQPLRGQQMVPLY